jgi:NmrA-like family
MHKKILIAGATGNLGGRIAKVLRENNVEVIAIVRKNSNVEKIQALEQIGINVIVVDMLNITEVTKACEGVTCVVSALAGLEDVIIDTQKVLLDAAVAAGVPRFIPSDFSLDFTKFTDGENRNLDLRRKFHTYLDKQHVKATTIFNGAFADMVTNEMPLILFKQKRILYWGNADHKMCFTTVQNTAEYTAQVAIDENSPRYLRINGDYISPREIKTTMTEVTKTPYRFFRPGGKGLLKFIIKIARKFDKEEKELYPAWQGMQYMCNMIDDKANIEKFDNDRYTNIKWTSIKDVVSSFLKL